MQTCPSILLRTLSNTAYYLALLAAGLGLIAVASAAIARHVRLRVLRRVKAVQLLDALATYADWIASQRRVGFFQGDGEEGHSLLQELLSIQSEWFPELSEEATQLFEVHSRLIDFLREQQLLRLEDAEAWFESDPDARFMELWRSHRDAAQALAEKLHAAGGVGDPGMEEEKRTFPA